MIVLLDNQDSFVYNLVDALVGLPGLPGPAGLSGLPSQETVVYRNTVSAETVLGDAPGGVRPDLIVLSPGPGYPRDAGCMMEVIARAQGRIPILGICLGYQALVEHHGGQVVPCGPEHGVSLDMQLSPAGAASPIFTGLTTDSVPGVPGRAVPVARYHSLGATQEPDGMQALAWAPTEIGDVIMAATTTDGMSIGLQFHPESLLTPAGPTILARCVEQLLKKGQHTHGN